MSLTRKDLRGFVLIMGFLFAAQGAQGVSYPMQLNSLNPTSGSPGATVRLIGTNFGASQAGHRVMIRHESAYLRDMSVTSWSNTEIRAVVPGDAKPGANTIAILNPVGRPGPVNASRHVAFTVLPGLKVPGVGLKPGPNLGVGTSPKPLPGLKPELKLKPAGCPDPSLTELKVGWPARNADGTYTFRLLAIVKNVGNAPFESNRRQTQIALREGPRVLKSEVWASRWADKVVLAPGEGLSSVHPIVKWNPSSEFLVDYSAEISYDPDVFTDANPKNNDCVMTNNKKTLTVAEIRRVLSSVR